jgi:hypothetical protein
MAGYWLVLDALGEGHQGRETLRQIVRREVEALGVDCVFVAIPETGLPSCRGCFACWTKTPGMCCSGDDPGLGRKIIGSAAVVVLTRLFLGGYAPSLRLAMERAVLPLLLPYFRKVHGRSRHAPRYPAPPSFYGIGWTAQPDPEATQVFCGLVARNAANMSAPRQAAGVVAGGEDPAATARLVRGVFAGRAVAGAQPGSFVILGGSPKAKGSTSAALGEHVAGWLAGRGAQVTTFSLAAARDSEDHFTAMAEAVGSAHGVCLTFPVYADQIPGVAADVLARLCAWRAEIPSSRAQRLLAVANCGFPEPANCDASLAMCRLFARQAGFAWLGGVAVGGGGLYEGRALREFGWLSASLRRALETKAALLLADSSPDLAATADLAVPCPLPARVYAWMADRGWNKALTGKEGRRDAFARPYEAGSKV